MTTKQTLGKLPPAAFGVLELPPLPGALIDAFKALDDLTGQTSDAMDRLGIADVVPGVSSMDGIMATVAKRSGEIGAIVDGAVRDIDHSRA